MSRPVIVSVSPAGDRIARSIAQLLAAPLHLCGQGREDIGVLVPEAFRAGVPVIGVCASGILIRLLAPHIGDKRAEPPVVAVSTDGKIAVPLLGGHHGANALARWIADMLQGVAAVTTASESLYDFALDEPPSGYHLANPEAAKQAMAALLKGQALVVDGPARWLEAAGYPVKPEGSVAVRVTERATADAGGLVFHPRTLVAGVGCERGVEAEEVVALVAQTLAEAGLARESLAALASIDLKADEAALNAAAAHFEVPLRLFSAPELAAERDRLPNPSALVEREVGTPGVAEAAALKAGRLIVAKRKSRRVTCAIGVLERPEDMAGLGRPRGALHIVGVGPGAAEQRTASAVAALTGATDWVGYSLYLDLVADLKHRQSEHRYPLGDEEVRVRHALELAGEGRDVALVCSGDGQIYAMAALVYELLDAQGARAVSDAARRVAIVSHPGISALQMASARAGALLGHDFCAISLSDLLTPRAEILARLEAAASGDFVTAFYNPRSKRRTDLMGIAREIYLAHRPPQTPVVVASNLGRADERVTVTTLEAFDPETVDMLTTVLFGASSSRAFGRGDGSTAAFTPRGYARKAAGAAR